MTYKDIILGAVMGHVVGDALGVPVEFISRDKLKNNPVCDMLEFGTHYQPKGTWSDDSSMMLCTLAGIAECRGIDCDDIMRRYSEWAKTGYMTPYGKPFGIGRTTFSALAKYCKGKAAQMCGCGREKDNGNGSLMRILPVSLYTMFDGVHQFTVDEKLKIVYHISALTHSHPRACVACGIYTFVLEELSMFPIKSAIEAGLRNAKNYYMDNPEIKAFDRLFSEAFSLTTSDDIKSSGYIVDTLEAAIWCLMQTDSYKECVLQAVNLGGDTDTIAAIAGSLAGILYGYENIPQKWIDVIVKKDMILELCDKFCGFICSEKANLNKKLLQTMDFEEIKALIQLGADPYLRNKYGDNVIAEVVLNSVDTTITFSEYSDIFKDTEEIITFCKDMNKLGWNVSDYAYDILNTLIYYAEPKLWELYIFLLGYINKDIDKLVGNIIDEQDFQRIEGNTDQANMLEKLLIMIKKIN